MEIFTDERDDIRGESYAMADFMIKEDPFLLEFFGGRESFVEVIDDCIDGDTQPLIIQLAIVTNGFRVNHEQCMEWLRLMNPDKEILDDLIEPDLTGYE